VDSYLSFCPFA